MEQGLEQEPQVREMGFAISLACCQARARHYLSKTPVLSWALWKRFASQASLPWTFPLAEGSRLSWGQQRCWAWHLPSFGSAVSCSRAAGGLSMGQGPFVWAEQASKHSPLPRSASLLWFLPLYVAFCLTNAPMHLSELSSLNLCKSWMHKLL